jgi:transposase
MGHRRVLVTASGVERSVVQPAFCWSHVRRSFYELAPQARRQLPAKRSNTAALYALEKDIRGRSADERRVAGQQKAPLLIDALEV